MLETAILQTLIRVEALNDQSTSEHAARLASLAEATARRLHLSSERIHLLTLAARLHDIGKVGIPRTILQKTGPLTEDEWVIMRTHPALGASFLTRHGGIFAQIAPIVLAHHERWDGDGYPYRLVGPDIPLEARIIAVVDAFDAMRSTRCYHEALSLQQACVELVRGVNTRYDPQVVEAFLASLPERALDVSLLRRRLMFACATMPALVAI